VKTVLKVVVIVAVVLIFIVLFAIVLVFVVLFVVVVVNVVVVVVVILVVLVILVVVRGRWGKVTTLAMWQKKVITGGNGTMAPLVVLVASGEIGKCQ